MSPPLLDKQLDDVLRVIPSASRKVFKLLLGNINHILARAFSMHNIEQGWQMAGYKPFDQQRILERCTTWNELDIRQSSAVIKALPALTEHGRVHGELPDDILQEKVGAALNLQAWLEHHMGKSVKSAGVHGRTLNYRRTILVSNKSVVEKFMKEEGARKRERSVAKQAEGRRSKRDAPQPGTGKAAATTAVQGAAAAASSLLPSSHSTAAVLSQLPAAGMTSIAVPTSTVTSVPHTRVPPATQAVLQQKALAFLNSLRSGYQPPLLSGAAPMATD